MPTETPILHYSSGDQIRRRVVKVVAWTAIIFGVLCITNMAVSTYQSITIAGQRMSEPEYSRFIAGLLVSPCVSVICYAIIAAAGLFLLNGVGFAAGLLRIGCILLIGWTLAMVSIRCGTFFQRSTLDGVVFVVSSLPFLCLPTMLVFLPIRQSGDSTP